MRGRLVRDNSLSPMSTRSGNEHVSPCHQLWWASSWKWTRSMLSFIAYSHPDIRFHPSASLVPLLSLRLQIVHSSRCTHINVQSHHSDPSSQKRNELIRYTCLHTIHESSSWHRFCLSWSEKARKQRREIGLGIPKLAAGKQMASFSCSSMTLVWLVGVAGVLLSAVGSGRAQFDIPERYDGFVYNGPGGKGRGPVVWEVFIDPLCIDCKIGWPVVKKVSERYGSSLVTIVHPFPAPFHHNAFFASRALHIADSTNSSLVYPLLERIFANQDSFSNPKTEHETPVSVVSRLIALAVELGISQNSFGAGFNNSHTDQATRISFKYGCSRGVVGTPTYFVNGVIVGGADESWSVNEWAKVFDPLVKSPGFILES